MNPNPNQSAQLPGTVFPVSRAFRVKLASLVPVFFISALPAQEAPRAPTSTPVSGEQTLVLDPFTVTSDSDVGYQAGNTLAGSRLNTKLSETPASITVFTEEFLKDLGATGLEQVLEYGVNSNIDYGALTTAPSFFFMDGGLLNDARVNNRGLVGSRTVDFVPTILPIDAYNSGRFDVSSGPNSVLFGLGATGGVVNSSTRAPDFKRKIGRTSIAAGSWNTYRAQVDFNIPIVRDRVALRLMGVHDESDTWREYGGRQTNRWTASLAVKPFKTTTFTALREEGNLHLIQSRPYNLVDNVSFWWSQGHRTVDNTSFGTSTSAVQNAYGIRGVGTRNIYVSGEGRTIFTRSGSANRVVYRSTSRYETGMNSGLPVERQESGTYQTLLPATPQADGLPYSPYDINYGGPESTRRNEIGRTFLRLQQQLGKHGFLEVSFNRENGSGFAYNLSGGELLGDPNLYLPNPDGTATRVNNPNAGRLYLERSGYHNMERQRYDVLRASASWEFDFGRLGQHRVAASAERTKNFFWTQQGPEILVNAATGVAILNTGAPENSQNYLYRRNYVTAGAPSTYIPGSLFEQTPIVYGGVTYVPRFVRTNGVREDNREIESYMLATQSHFWKNRLIVTGGLRRDTFDRIGTLNARVSADDPRVRSGELTLNEYAITGYDEAGRQHHNYNTFTAGAVFVATNWLRAFYNTSNNNSEPPTGRRILPDLRTPSPPKGEGKDWGLMMNFMDGRVFVRATAYHSMLTGDPTVRDAAFINAQRRIVDAILDAGLITQAVADERSYGGYSGDFLSDLDTKGYELEIKANPSRNLTLSFAYSYTKLLRSKLGDEWYPWFAEQKAFYAKYPSTLVTSLGIPISSEISQIETGVESVFAANRFGYNNRPNKANVFGRYTFDGGPLKGVFVGGGARWQERNNVQPELLGRDASGKDILGGMLRGPQIFDVDALLGYSTRLKAKFFGNNVALRVQLNVRNLFDNDDVQVIRFNRAGDGGYWRVVAREPRSFRLTTSFDF